MPKKSNPATPDAMDFEFNAAALDVGAMDFEFREKTDTPDPLAEVDYAKCNGVGEESKAEVSALLTAFKARQKQEQKRFQDATDSEYWFVVCFRSREEKETFLKKFDLATLGDKYLDGSKVEKALANRD